LPSWPKVWAKSASLTFKALQNGRPNLHPRKATTSPTSSSIVQTWRRPHARCPHQAISRSSSQTLTGIGRPAKVSSVGGLSGSMLSHHHELAQVLAGGGAVWVPPR
jgi:hypothetical protein